MAKGRAFSDRMARDGRFRVRGNCSRALALAAAALLAGCLHPPQRGATTPAPEAAAAPAPSASDAPGKGDRIARLPPVDDDPEKLMGLDAAALRARLGPPRFLRRDKPAQLWRYAASHCVLELFLYRSDPSGTYVVRHFAARPMPETGQAISARACLNALLTARRNAPG